MHTATDADRHRIQEIILAYFELFDKKTFTRKQVCDAVLADREMPRVNEMSTLVLEIFDKVRSEQLIQSVGGMEENEKFRLA